MKHLLLIPIVILFEWGIETYCYATKPVHLWLPALFFILAIVVFNIWIKRVIE